MNLHTATAPGDADTKLLARYLDRRPTSTFTYSVTPDGRIQERYRRDDGHHQTYTAHGLRSLLPQAREWAAGR